MSKNGEYIEVLGGLLNDIDSYLYVNSSPLFGKIIFTKQYKSEKKIKEILEKFAKECNIDIQNHDFYDLAADLRKVYRKVIQGSHAMQEIACYDIYHQLKEVPLLKSKLVY